MSVLDFKEIPQANKATGEQDEFELFSRDFLEYLGYNIVSEPDRGQDGGMDILVQESRKGIGGETRLVWLVSCKHFAHSNTGKGKAVGVDDEVNVSDRVKSNRCNGFIGVYSTIASSGLTRKLQGWAEEDKKEFQVFHRGKIENFLFGKEEGLNIARRYFPISMQKWDALNRHSNARISFQQDPNIVDLRQHYYDEYIQKKRQKKIKSFIYLDEYKMYSISSQIFEGLTEYITNYSKKQNEDFESQEGPVGSGRILADIISRESSTEERKFLHDYSYSLFEERLLSEERVLSLDSDNLDETISKLEDCEFVRVRGRLLLMISN